MLAAGVVTLVAAPAWAVNAPALYLAPTATTITKGQTVVVQVREDSGHDMINAVQANVVYDADDLSLSSVDVEASAFNIAAEQTTATGLVRIARGKTGAPLTGSQTIAKLTFTAKNTGSADLSFGEGSVVVNSQSNESIGAALVPTSLTINPAAATPSATPAPSHTPSPTATPSVKPSASPSASPKPSTGDPQTLPETGAVVFSSTIGLGAIGYGAHEWLRSRGHLKNFLRKG